MGYPSTFDSTLGLLEIGGFLAVFLFGLVTLQMFIYYGRYPNDPKKIKALVRFYLHVIPSLLTFVFQLDRWEQFGLYPIWYSDVDVDLSQSCCTGAWS